MPRIVRLAAAQMGATHRTDSRENTMSRMLRLVEDAAAQRAQVVLFPEIAFTTFFPRYIIHDKDELDSWYEHGDVTNNPQTRPLFDRAKELNIDISVGFAEATDDGRHFNTCIYYSSHDGSVIGKYRKIHLPGTFEPFENLDAVQQLEKRYFKPGDLGWRAFRVPGLDKHGPPGGRGDPVFGMMICNDRRWAEAWRVLGLQGVEVVLCGFNTAGFAPDLWGSDPNEDPKEAEARALFQHKLSMQAHSYTNATFSVSAARCGYDDGKFHLIAGSCIVGPEGYILAESKTLEDEIIVADCDLDACKRGKETTFNFGKHRRIEHYKLITEQTGVVEPPLANGATGTVMNGTSVNGVQRNKIRILLCNPNSTKFMTDNCVEMVKLNLPPDVEVVGLTAPAPAPTAIEGNLDNVLSAAAAVRAVLPIASDFDAILIACYSDHALIRMLREELKQPVIGIMEASLFAARTLGARFGIIAASTRFKVMHADAVRHYGLDSFCVGVGSCDLGVLELKSRPTEEVMRIMADVGKDLVSRGADTLTLGCAGMTLLKPAVEEAVGQDVTVIDGVVAGVHHLVGMVRMGGKTAKAGLYRSSEQDRVAREQKVWQTGWRQLRCACRPEAVLSICE